MVVEHSPVKILQRLTAQLHMRLVGLQSMLLPVALLKSVKCKWRTPLECHNQSASWLKLLVLTLLVKSQSKKAVRDVFDLRPGAIVRDLDLKRPIYAKTAAYGHFGRPEPEFHLGSLVASG
jgi:hypothetical protein